MTIDEINAVHSEVISEFREHDQAHFQHMDGRESFVSVVRFDPFLRDDMAGMASINEDQSIWVSVAELPSPMVGDGVSLSGEQFEVRRIEPHKLRGYNKLFISEVN